MGAAAVLTILKDGETVKSVPLEGEASVGRGEDCVIRLEDRAVSRDHALVRKAGDVYQIERRSEFGPLSVNGAECTQAVLKEGDVIAIGPYRMKFSAKEQQAQQQPEQPLQAVAPVDPAAVSAATSDMDLAKPDSQVGELVAVGEGEAQSDAPADADGVLNLESPDVDGGGGQQASELEPIGEGDATRVVAVSQSALRVSLSFVPGQANVTEYEIIKTETFIGRDKECDVVLNDKRSSRKNTSILRKGLDFLIRDLGSSNGTYVNGERIEEKPLSGNDVIRIGDVEFTFKAVQQDYEEKAKDFLSVPAAAEGAGGPAELAPFNLDSPGSNEIMAAAPVQDPIGMGGVPNAADAMGMPVAGSPGPQGIAPVAGYVGHNPGDSSGLSGVAGIAGISGVGGNASGKRQSLMEKFRALPKQRQYIVIVLVIAFAYLFLFDDEDPQKKPQQGKPKTAQVQGAHGPSGAAGGSGATDANKAVTATFEMLSPEQRRFVETEHDLAFNYYKNREYDKSLFEIGKIFSLVQDYKDSREIERYAKEGKRKMDAIAEEKRKREEEAVIKKKIADLVAEAQQLMDAKSYDKARESFVQILALDPENKEVANWRARLNDVEDEKKIAAQREMVQAEVNKQAWAVYKEGLALRRQGKRQSAASVFNKVKDVKATDRRPAALARKQIVEMHEEVAQKLGPALEQARKSEQDGDYQKALTDYQAVLKIDNAQDEARQGLERMRGILRDRAKTLYTEAVLAESYSDFVNAKKKFKACLEVAPADDLYHDRCERKIARYFKLDDGSGGGGGEMGGGGGGAGPMGGEMGGGGGMGGPPPGM